MEGPHRWHQANASILIPANFARDGTHALTAIDDLHSLFGKIQDFLTLDNVDSFVESLAEAVILSSSAASAGSAYDSSGEG
jgi:hypothetical protein